ncbi:hypothetical protein ACFL6N_06120 [Thermodesulfobacteriota bacterium]
MSDKVATVADMDGLLSATVEYYKNLLKKAEPGELKASDMANIIRLLRDNNIGIEDEDEDEEEEEVVDEILTDPTKGMSEAEIADTLPD